MVANGHKAVFVRGMSAEVWAKVRATAYAEHTTVAHILERAVSAYLAEEAHPTLEERVARLEARCL